MNIRAVAHVQKNEIKQPAATATKQPL